MDWLPTFDNGTNAFRQASSTVDLVESLVDNHITRARDNARTLQSAAEATLAAMGNVNLDFNAGPMPTAPAIDNTPLTREPLPGINGTTFGNVTYTAPTLGTLDLAGDIPNLVIPEFNPSVTGLNIPLPPAWTAPTQAPDSPTVEDVTVPDMPVLAMPVAPTLAEITVPTFDGLTLPTFDSTEPEFAATALPGLLQWSEPTYHTEILGDVIAQLRKMWAGGSGLPEAVEQAMWARAADREDLTALRAIDSVADEFSLRGFTSPTGMQAARVDQMRQDLTVKKLGLNRELTIQVAQWQIENMRFACEQGIAAENVLVNVFLNTAARLFEAAKFRIESQLNIYGAQVNLFNARMNGLQIRAAVFNARVQAELTKVEVFKATIDAEVARGQLNTQKVQAYGAMIDALKAQTEMYRTQMQGAEIKASVIRNRIEIFKAQVQAYAEQIGAQKTQFDAYESQVKGEAAKAGILDSEARAYAALIQGKSAAADIDVKRISLKLDNNRAKLQEFTGRIELEKASVQAQLAGIQAAASAYTADTQRYSAEASAMAAKGQLESSTREAQMRTNVALYQAQVQAYIANMEQMMRKAALSLDAMKAAGSMASTLAAGAMASVHVGATLGGSASLQAGASTSVSAGQSETESTSFEGGKK